MYFKSFILFWIYLQCIRRRETGKDHSRLDSFNYSDLEAARANYIGANLKSVNGRRHRRNGVFQLRAAGMPRLFRFLAGERA